MRKNRVFDLKYIYGPGKIKYFPVFKGNTAALSLISYYPFVERAGERELKRNDSKEIAKLGSWKHPPISPLRRGSLAFAFREAEAHSSRHARVWTLTRTAFYGSGIIVIRLKIDRFGVLWFPKIVGRRFLDQILAIISIHERGKRIKMTKSQRECETILTTTDLKRKNRNPQKRPQTKAARIKA